ncbi:dicarboxylate/amino acid:cation symporter [Dokdonella sp.]|uniref:dicarboxylate/amino acid:cation symporter n=1 Tax=Dokdonella sp. TaxID=2291710 RepID=UPI0031BEF970|nr:dicarboxylate/amino acid:cation symporter [Dokdonella sp.]
MSKSTPLATRILWGLVIGVVAAVATLGVGHFHPPTLEFMQDVSSAVFDPFGQVFLRMLFFVVIPLVFASLASGVAQLGRLDRLGPLTARTFSLFALNMLIGVAIGLVMMNTLRPGEHMDPQATEQLLAEYGAAENAIPAQAAQSQLTLSTLVEMFMPRNLVGAVAGQSRNALGDVLPLILFAILFGAAATQLGERHRKLVLDGLDALAEIMTRIVHFALELAPYAVPAMIYSVIVKVGLDVLLVLSVFVVGCALAMALHLFGTMSLWVRFLAGQSPRAFFRKIRPVLVTAFSTSSSNATLPTALAAANEDLKLRPSTSGFVLPLGSTMNMSGTALYEGCVVLFVAQVFGVHLPLGQQVILMLLSVLSAVAVAGIPGGSLPLIAGLLATFGVPPEGIGIIIGVDRVLDMMRTTVNVGSDVVTAAVVDRQMRRANPDEPAGVTPPPAATAAVD